MTAEKRFALVSDEFTVDDAVLFGAPGTSAWFDIGVLRVMGVRWAHSYVMTKRKTLCCRFGVSVQRKVWLARRLFGYRKDLHWMTYLGKTWTT